MTLSVRIIACLDVTDGRVVKGVNFTDLVDAGDPVEMAALYDSEGVDELTFFRYLSEFSWTRYYVRCCSPHRRASLYSINRWWGN